MNGYINGKPDIAWWLAQIRGGIGYRKRYAKEGRWDIWRAFYRGDWKAGVLPSALFFRMLRTVVPRVYFRNPSVSILSRRPGMLNWALAQLLERMDNKMIRQMKMKKQIKAIVQDTFLFGTGIGKLGFSAEFSPTPDQDNARAVDVKGKRLEYNATVFPSMPWFMRTPTGNFIVPAGARCLDDSRWVAESFSRPVDDVKMDTRLKNVKDMMPTSLRSPNSVRPDAKITKFHQPQDMMDMIEIRDKKTEKVIILAPHRSDKVLLFEDDGMQLDGRLPYFESVFNQDDEVFWGIPDSVHLEPQQLEINEIRKLQMLHRRLAIIKILYKKGAIKPAELDKLMSEDPYAAVEVEGEPSTDILPLQVGGIPDDLFKADLQVMSDVRENLGFSRNEFGETSPASARTTAAETKIVKMASEIRIDERRDIIADLLVEVVKDMHQIIFNYWGSEQVIDVVGPMGVPLWIHFQPEILKSGKYEVSIDPDSSLPQTRELREAKAVQVYTILKQNPIIDPLRLTRYLLHEMHGVQFDDMMRQFGPQAGGQQNPLSVGQFTQLAGAVAQRAPAALPQSQADAA